MFSCALSIHSHAKYTSRNYINLSLLWYRFEIAILHVQYIENLNETACFQVWIMFSFIHCFKLCSWFPGQDRKQILVTNTILDTDFSFCLGNQYIYFFLYIFCAFLSLPLENEFLVRKLLVPSGKQLVDHLHQYSRGLNAYVCLSAGHNLSSNCESFNHESTVLNP